MSAKKVNASAESAKWKRFIEAVKVQGFDPSEHAPGEVVAKAKEWVSKNRARPTETGFVVVHFRTGAFVRTADGDRWEDLPADVKGLAEISWRKKLHASAAARHDRHVRPAPPQEEAPEPTVIRRVFVEFSVLSDGVLNLEILEPAKATDAKLHALFSHQAHITQRYHAWGAGSRAHYIAAQLSDRLQHELWPLLRAPRGGMRGGKGRPPTHRLTDEGLKKFARAYDRFLKQKKGPTKARELAAQKCGVPADYGQPRRADALRRLQEKACALLGAETHKSKP